VHVTHRLALLLLLLIGAQATAIENVAPFEDPAMQERYEHIVKELRCLVCQNESIADSNALLAADLRREVREMMVAGRSDAEIKDFMVHRYGEWILFRPRLLPQTWLLWFAPVLLLLPGVFIATRVIRNRARLYRDDPGELTDEPDA
jgi:cytochrome c-type biogenesis protein CcmH